MTTVPNLSRYSFLIVDDQSFHRRLMAETLRALGVMKIEMAASPDEALQIMRAMTIDVLILDWMMEPIDGLELTRRIRRGETTAPNRKIPIILCTARNTAADVDTARNAGVDEFMTKPFTTGSLMSRILAVLTNRRQFIDSSIYIGPCRRRKQLIDYDGPMRRLFDDPSAAEENPEVQLKKRIAREALERATAITRQVTPGDRARIREVFSVAREIQTIAGQLCDPMLTAAADSLTGYIQGVGASARFDPAVVEAHVEAMTQLVNLPNVEAEMREKVAKALHTMVRKKLTAVAS
jgi:CheY-like chemotaxis protein